MPNTTPAAWSDGDPLMEATASAVWEQCRTENSIVVDDPRNIAAAAAKVARQLLGTSVAEGVTPSADRRDRYAAAIWEVDALAAVMAVADAEQASLRAETEGLDEALRGAISASEKDGPRLRTDRAAEVEDLRAELDKLIRWHKEDGAQAVKAGAAITRLRAERAELNRQLDCLRGDMRDMESCVREQDAEFERIRRLADGAAAGVQPPTTTEAHRPCVEYIAEVLEDEGVWMYLGADPDPAVAARRRASVTRRHPDAETRTVRKTTTYTVEPTEPPTHLPKGTNAEDCPACKGTNPDYPFLCPGPTPAVVHACPPDGSGLTPCCHRPPFEMQADRMTTDPTAVTCPTPPAAPAAPEEPTP